MNPDGNPRRAPRAGAFTLAELLVVLAILSLLAALILPALRRSRTAARATVCISNLRQMGLAAQLYWDDHGGIAFVERGARTNNGWNYWFGWLEDGPEGSRRFEPASGALWPYLRHRGVEVCPALDRSDPGFKGKARGAAFGYGYNLRIGTRGVSGIAMAGVRAPAECAVFADCAQVNDFQAPASPDHPLLEEFHYFDLEGPTVHFRHGLRAKAWFVDGHVAGHPPAEGSEDLRLPSAHVARLPASLILP